jgi:hypothetical protein
MLFNGAMFYAIPSYSYDDNVGASYPRPTNYLSVGSSVDYKLAIPSINNEVVASLLTRSLAIRRTMNYCGAHSALPLM